MAIINEQKGGNKKPMKTMKTLKTQNKITTEHLTLEDSFQTIKEDKSVQLNCSIGIKDGGYGWFEVFDEKTGGNEWYAEGGLWFDADKVVDYDGVFALPNGVIQLLNENGYNTEEVI